MLHTVQLTWSIVKGALSRMASGGYLVWLFHLYVVVEQVEDGASLHGVSINNDHVCVKMKAVVSFSGGMLFCMCVCVWEGGCGCGCAYVCVCVCGCVGGCGCGCGWVCSCISLCPMYFTEDLNVHVKVLREHLVHLLTCTVHQRILSTFCEILPPFFVHVYER